jgi:hypothetical protein
VELATFVPGENANLLFAVFALVKLILVIMIVVFSLYVNGSLSRSEDANTYRGKADFNQSAADALDRLKKALAKEGVKDGIIFLILFIVALLILFKLVLPSIV